MLLNSKLHIDRSEAKTDSTLLGILSFFHGGHLETIQNGGTQDIECDQLSS